MSDVNSKQYDVFANPVRGKVAEGVLTGRLRRAVATVSVDNSAGELDTGGDKAKLTWLPKGAYISEIRVFSSGVSGLTDADIGDANDADGLVDGLDLTGNGSTEVISDYDASLAITPETDLDKELWELLGYSSKKDAPAQIELWLTSNTGAGGDGNIAVEVHYVEH